MCKNPFKELMPCLKQERGKKIKDNREVLHSIAQCVLFCGRQSIPLRGHRDDETATSGNRGNFYELLQFRVDSGDIKLANHLKTAAKNARYSSKTVQNELINIIGEGIREKILEEIRQAKFFSILSDEVTDSANVEQVTMTIRFVDASSEIREEFMGFKSAERITDMMLFWYCIFHNLYIYTLYCINRNSFRNEI